ncbi:hypothetical protein ACIPL1_24695 [Pseudomonas sp. NPDC090202]|uniref:hypothetical protein n=1 Tax=Pseudomonas sp. NPDC090202 TaxID=3364476 RepID=UPI00381A6AF7
MALKLKPQATQKTDAVWFDYDDETKVQLVGIDHQEYQVAIERLRRRLRNNDARFEEGRVGIVDGEKTEHQNQCLLLASFILKDWSGALDADGNPLKYNQVIAAQMLEGDVDFFLFVLQKAGELAQQQREELAETLGKSSPDSSGKESGQETSKSEPPSTDA